MPTLLADLYGRLTRDEWRDDHAHSPEMDTANQVLLDPFARDYERRVAIQGWLQSHQPCLFGRLAAKRNGIHYCFLATEDLLRSEAHVRTKVAASKVVWKQRALRGEPRHGFLLLVCDRKVAAARPDENLRQFALRLQRLAFGGGRRDPEGRGNPIIDESLYLRHPSTNAVVKFVFSVDFFAAAGDGRWWHDHRIPGGIGFTANSLGHAVRWQEWYDSRTDRIEWALRTAMLTIDAAEKQVPHGPATFLIAQPHDRPIRPFEWTNASPPRELAKLAGKDLGSYAGYLHTDHCVRLEFFQEQDAPMHKESPWLMDFAYIFDQKSPDYTPFMIGHPVTDAEVERELGRTAEMRTMGLLPSVDEPSPSVSRATKAAIETCQSWRMTDRDEARLL